MPLDLDRPEPDAVLYRHVPTGRTCHPIWAARGSKIVPMTNHRGDIRIAITDPDDPQMTDGKAWEWAPETDLLPLSGDCPLSCCNTTPAAQTNSDTTTAYVFLDSGDGEPVAVGPFPDHAAAALAAAGRTVVPLRTPETPQASTQVDRDDDDDDDEDDEDEENEDGTTVPVTCVNCGETGTAPAPTPPGKVWLCQPCDADVSLTLGY